MSVGQQDHGPIAGRALPCGLEQVEHFPGRKNDHAAALATDGTDFLNGPGNYGKVLHGILPWIFGF
jgi:hypothetical protein